MNNNLFNNNNINEDTEEFAIDAGFAKRKSNKKDKHSSEHTPANEAKASIPYVQESIHGNAQPHMTNMPHQQGNAPHMGNAQPHMADMPHQQMNPQGNAPHMGNAQPHMTDMPHQQMNPQGNAHHMSNAPHMEYEHNGEETYTAKDVNETTEMIERFIQKGRLAAALNLIFSLRGGLLHAVNQNVSVTVPLGCHDNELRQIAAGALFQSYLELGRLDEVDLTDKLYAIIESSEPDYDENDEIIERTVEEIEYKVLACIVFAAQLTEASGEHPEQKAQMYGDESSILDAYLSERLPQVMKKSRRKIEALCNAIRLNGGEVSAKLDSYAVKRKDSFFAKFLGQKKPFIVTASIIAVLWLVSVIVYLLNPSKILSFIATDNNVMLFIVLAEVFFTAGMGLLSTILICKSMLPRKK